MRDEVVAAEMFCYDAEAVTCLRWKFDRGSRVDKGDIAGYLHKESGYYYVDTCGTQYFVARLVYVLHNGPVPAGMVIDHFDGDKSNNRIDNLRCVTQQVNTQNTELSKSNTSGIKGVHLKSKLLPSGALYEAWVATWRSEGKTLCKEFSTGRYLDARERATAYRCKIIDGLMESGQQYTARHLSK